MALLESGAGIESVQTRARSIVIGWADGHTSEFHHIWLRDNCRCAECYHPETRERLFDTLSLDMHLAPSAVARGQAGELQVIWPDGHLSAYPSDFLLAHCYSPGARAARRDIHTLWRGDELIHELPEIGFATVMADDVGLARFLRLLWDHGVVFVRDTPLMAAATRELVNRISWRRRTNYGAEWHVRTVVEPNNVAYTALGLQHHTDLPNWETPPGVQFLHCLESSAPGGESILADGFYAAAVLAERRPDAYELLCTVDIPFEFHDADYDLRWRAPVLERGVDGAVRSVRYHIALTAPLDVEARLVEPVYSALQAFGLLLREPGMQLEIRLEPGDLMVFHNRRVLHGRRPFDTGSGSRHLYGAYIDIDDLRSKMRMLGA